MRILIACERSGVVRRAFRALGHNAWSCDLEPADDGSPYHFQGDALGVAYRGVRVDCERGCLGETLKPWCMLIGHPPCTHLSLSGARWLTDHWVKRKNKAPRWHDGSAKRAAQLEAVAFFKALWNAPIARICLENPMSMASTLVAPKTQTIHPWQFGHGECKTTWLWLKNLPPWFRRTSLRAATSVSTKCHPAQTAHAHGARATTASQTRWPRSGAH